MFLKLVRGLSRLPSVRSNITEVAWHSLPPAVYVLTYHRIGDWRATSFDAATFSCDAERFRRHLMVVKERFEVIDLPRLRHLQESGAVPARPLALITFDDGYRDNYLAAFPILRELEVPAVFFLPTGLVGTSQVPWWDEVAWTVRHARAERLSLPGDREGIPLAGADVERSISRVLKWVKHAEAMPLPDRMDAIRLACNAGARPAAEDADLLLGWDEVRAMHAAGMSIGSHTHTHRLLAQLPLAEQEQELARSKEILEAELRSPVESIAYPVGGHYCYTQETRHLARKLGYRIGFNHTNAVARLPVSDALDVARLMVDDRGPEERLRFGICFPGAN
jgi:peptidoglycan/xylan/chitin deacetylase (PgdA/CDA1 family)